jgi:hypothetical protein
MSPPNAMTSARKLRRSIRTFLDESGILTNMTRRYARAPVGERACGEAPVRWKRLTVLGLDGVVTMTTVTTGTTIPVFIDFLQTSVLPVLRDQKPDAIWTPSRPIRTKRSRTPSRRRG